ncbi:MAG TPA: protein kinase [Pirellulales bacterium]|nr:protein kinase [Pirellulales bacterium]
MSISVAEFWKLAVESRALTAEECRKLADAYARAKGAPPTDQDLQKLAKALIANGAISRYQAKVLLAGRAGPFVYGDYLVYDRLESGRLAGLFRARHLATKYPVCLYFLSGPALQDPQAAARLAPPIAAAQAASAEQPHLARCFHWSDLGGFKFVVIEDLHGESVAERLSAKGKLPAGEACRIVRQAAIGVESLHGAKQTHGQIRPANLWLGEYGQVKLLGFPLAQDPLGAPQTALEAQADYLAPELAQGARAPDARSDVYSLGCTLFHLLAGHPLFGGGDVPKKLARHASEAPALDKLHGLAPPALVQVLAYMLNKNPDQRYQQAAAVVQALAPYTGTEKTSEPTPQPSAQPYEIWLKQLAASAANRVATPAGPDPVGAGRAAGNGTGVAPRPAAAAAFGGPAPSPAAVATLARPMAAAPPGAVRVAAVASPMTAAPMAPFPAFQPAPVVAAPNESIAARRGKKSGGSLALLASLMVGVLLVIGTVAAIKSINGEPNSAPADRQTPPTQPQALDEQAARQVAAATEGTPEAIQSIGPTIWQSPTEGEPLDLAYLAPGAQVILALRPAEIVSRPEWQKLSDARTLGALSEWLTTGLPKAAGTTLENIDSAIIGLLDASPGPPRVTIVARTVSAAPREELLAAWGAPQAEQIEKETIWVNKDVAYFLPAAGAQQIIVIAPPNEMREIAASNGQPPALRREIESLVETSDAERHFTLLFAPNFTFSGAKALFTEQGAKLQGPLDAFLVMENGDGQLELPKAAELSLQLGDELFVELRVYNSYGGKPMGTVVQEFRDRIARLPKQISEYVRDLYLSDYSKPVLWDYKDQLDLLNKYARAGVDGKQAVLRAYLPAAAAHNLALGAHLALLENSGQGRAATAVVSSQPPKASVTIAEKLKQKTSLSFPRNTLETSLKLLGDDIGIEIMILGGDLQQEGITKNQSFGLDERDQPAGDILRKIMLLSNPAGKLVYVIKPKEGGGEETLYVTTRAAAAKRGDPLPPELEAKK